MNSLEKAFEVLSKVKFVLFSEVPAGKGMCDEHEEKPAQTEYHCIAETDEGLKCVASIYAVGLKALSYHPYAPSGCCSTCNMLDGVVDGQPSLNALLQHVLTRVDTREATKDEYMLCHEVQYLECGCENSNPPNLGDDSPPSFMLN